MDLRRYAALVALLIGGACAALPFAKPPEFASQVAPDSGDQPVVKLEVPDIAAVAGGSLPVVDPAVVAEASWHQPTPIVLPPEGAPLPSLPRQPVVRDTASRIHEPDFTAPVAPPLPPRAQVRRKHRIADGDSLATIALRYLGDQSRGEEIAALNRDVILNPSLLPVGREIVIPGE
jgi:nucleoid-associated protein YgaU